MWLSGCSCGGSAYHLPFSRMVTLLKIFSSVTYKLHVCRGAPMQIYKNRNGIKERSFCKYCDMIKQLLLKNMYKKKRWAQPRARKPRISFSLEMWWEFLYIGFFIWYPFFWKNGSERTEREKLEGGRSNEVWIKLGRVKCHCKMLEPWTNGPLWTICVVWIDIIWFVFIRSWREWSKWEENNFSEAFHLSY